MDSRMHVTSPRSAYRPRDGIRGGDPVGVAQHPPGPDAPRPSDQDRRPHGQHRQRCGHDVEAPEAARDARGFGNVEAVMAGGPPVLPTLCSRALPALRLHAPGLAQSAWGFRRGVSS